MHTRWFPPLVPPIEAVSLIWAISFLVGLNLGNFLWVVTNSSQWSAKISYLLKPYLYIKSFPSSGDLINLLLAVSDFPPSKILVIDSTLNEAFALSLANISEVPPEYFDYWLEGMSFSAYSLDISLYILYISCSIKIYRIFLLFFFIKIEKYQLK